MVNIKLDHQYSIEADPLQWILIDNERPSKYFQSLIHLLEYYVSLKSGGSDSREVVQLLNYQKKLLEGLLQSLNTILQKDTMVQNAIIFLNRYYEPQHRKKIADFLLHFKNTQEVGK